MITPDTPDLSVLKIDQTEPSVFKQLADSGELVFLNLAMTGGQIVARFVRVEEPGSPHYRIEACPDACGWCLKDPAAGFASIGDVRFCHGDDDAEPTCYMQAQWATSFDTPHPPATPEGETDAPQDPSSTRRPAG